MLRPGLVVQRKVGGQPGNRNALKHGCEKADKRDLRRRIAAFRRNARALILQVRNELKARKEAHQ
jgi:hypothetical protein